MLRPPISSLTTKTVENGETSGQGTTLTEVPTPARLAREPVRARCAVQLALVAVRRSQDNGHGPFAIVFVTTVRAREVPRPNLKAENAVRLEGRRNKKPATTGGRHLTVPVNVDRHSDSMHPRPRVPSVGCSPIHSPSQLTLIASRAGGEPLTCSRRRSLAQGGR